MSFKFYFSSIFLIFLNLNLVKSTQIVLASNPCPDKWTYSSRLNSCYYLPEILLPFVEANNYCQNVTTGEMVTILSNDEYTYVMDLMSKHSSGGLYPFWIGLVPDSYYPYWQWRDGTRVSNPHWYHDDIPPKDNSNNTCIAWRTVPNDDGWLSMACKYSQPFICKQPSRNCQTVIIKNQTEGNFTSPNYPLPYPLDSNCFYHITVPEGHVVQVHFDLFDIDYFDQIIIYDGPDDSSDKLDRIYGDFVPYAYFYYWETTTKEMTVQFIMDSYSLFGPGEGFIMHFTSRKLPEPTHLDPVSGTLTSPNYPGNYTEDLELMYTIEAPDGMIIEFVINDFVTENNYDWLRIFDGLVESDDNRILNWSGDQTSNVPKTLQTTSSKSLIIFTTDTSANYKGFTLNYRSIPNLN